MLAVNGLLSPCDSCQAFHGLLWTLELVLTPGPVFLNGARFPQSPKAQKKEMRACFAHQLELDGFALCK